MTIKERRDVKVEVKKIYVADDGTEFQNEEECKAYEATTVCTINEMFNKLKIQRTAEENCYRSMPLRACRIYDEIIAVKIENVNQLEIVNKWIMVNSRDGFISFFGDEAIGTIQLLDFYEDGVSLLGTPEEFKKSFSDEVDELYNKLVEGKGEESC